jgi:hypothetical protein
MIMGFSYGGADGERRSPRVCQHRRGGASSCIVIKVDEIIMEEYFAGYDESVGQVVTDYVPELAQAGFGRVELEHLLQITSGMEQVEEKSAGMVGLEPCHSSRPISPAETELPDIDSDVVLLDGARRAATGVIWRRGRRAKAPVQ